MNLLCILNEDWHKPLQYTHCDWVEYIHYTVQCKLYYTNTSIYVYYIINIYSYTVQCKLNYTIICIYPRIR